ncbi:MAG TPA: hypothetical protein VKO83_14655 [Steroidobacteraceae bacterium]|nr:hypothetical protein [Steroidobacteraceae bacterium]
MSATGPMAILGAFALFTAAGLRSAEPSLPACMAGPPAAITVRIGSEAAPRRAWLRGGISPPLEVIDAESSASLWTAAAWPPASQRFDALRAQFAGSLLPLDLDGDGIHDRVYAGDLAGRLWRFDLHHGQPAERWATGGVFADLSSGALRGFVAPPDVSLSAPAGEPGFSIALGTARLGPAPVDNRFYVLRDGAAFESWTQLQYDRWRALRESDLARLPRLGATLPAPAPNGYFIEVPGADILSPALTVSGQATLAIADAGSLGPGCSIAATVSSIDLVTGGETGMAAAASARDARLTVLAVAGEAFALLREGSRASCMLGNTHIPSCDVDLSPRRTWWRREDAD